MEEDHTLLWNNMNLPPPEDDLGLYLDMEGPNSSVASSPPSSTVAPPNSSHPSVPSLSMDQIEEFLLTDDHDHDHLRDYSHDPSKINDFLSDILLDSPLPLTDLHYPSSSSTSTSSHDNNNIDNTLSQSQSPSLSPPEKITDASPPRDCDCDLQPTSPLSHNSQPQLQTKDSSEHPELQQPSSPSTHNSQPQLEEDRHHDHANINHHEDDTGDDLITKKRKR